MKNTNIGFAVLVLLLAGSAGEDGPLHVAVPRRDLPAVKANAEQSAAIIASGMYGRTPLYYAALCGDRNIGAYLPSRSANPKKALVGRAPTRRFMSPPGLGTLAAYKHSWPPVCRLTSETAQNRHHCMMRLVTDIRMLFNFCWHAAQTSTRQTKWGKHPWRIHPGLSTTVVALPLAHGTDPNISGCRGALLRWAKRKGYTDREALLINGATE